MDLSRESPQPSETTQLLEAKLRLENQAKNGANWFYWIAALSIINSVILIAGGTLSFIFGLAITQVIDAFAYLIETELGTTGPGIITFIGLILDVIVAGIFAIIGVLSRSQNRVAYIVGVVLYGLDALISLLLQYWLGAFFHLVVVGALIRGLNAMNKLRPIAEGTASIEVLHSEVIEPEEQKQSRKRIAILVAAIIVVCLILVVIGIFQGTL
jgi:hypothetical protein